MKGYRKLSYSDSTKFNRGLGKLVRLLSEIIRSERTRGEVSIAATGGFKAEIAVANLVGALLGTPVYYIYEQFEQLIKLEPIPITLAPVWLCEGSGKSLLNRLSKDDCFNKKEIDSLLKSDNRLEMLLDSEEIESEGTDCLKDVDAILVPGGFGERGVEGKIATVKYARENGVPYLGICLGMQVAVIEYARHVAGLKDAHSTEFEKDAKDPVIALITEWTTAEGEVERRSEESDLGGTMRLGGQECVLADGSKSRELYGKSRIIERHRHRYEFNNTYLDVLQDAGLAVVGRSADGSLLEMVEIPEHPWFVACQFHPEFTSTPRNGHPLFSGFITAARAHAEK